MEIVDLVVGPSGGMVALGFAGGYLFASRTILKEAKERITRLESKVEELNMQLIAEIRGNDPLPPRS